MLTEQEVKRDWFKTIENQVISSEIRKMIDSVKYSLGRELTLTDKEIATIYVLVIKSFTEELKNRNETFTEQKMMTTFSNFMYIYQTEGYDNFFEKFKQTITSLRTYGLDKELKRILKSDEDINFVSRFYIKDNKQHYLVVNNFNGQFQDVFEKKGFFKNSYVTANTLNRGDFVNYINVQYDISSLTELQSIETCIKEYTQIPFSAVIKMGLTFDELGLKQLDNYFSKPFFHTTDYHMYREVRKKEIEKRKHEGFEIPDLGYPWC